ncbi:MAG: ribonuclease HII [Methanothrix sp.]|nr:ribonuclease HII [Methanothrix sp.]
MRLLGIDEAGKGPVVGSMFVAGLVVDEERLFELAAMGIRDSKQLSSERREVLSRRILGIATDHFILEVTPRMIDELRSTMTMNDLMVRCFSQVLRRLPADRAILDAADVDSARFAQRVRYASGTSIELIAEHRADERYQVVSAASILAKVRRDASIRELEASLKRRIGSGYPHDRETLEFLEGWVRENGELPPCARQSWATARRIKASFI